MDAVAPPAGPWIHGDAAGIRSRSRVLVAALVASVLVHAALLVSTTLAPVVPRSPPAIQVNEATPVEVVLEGASVEMRTPSAGVSLPLEALQPATSEDGTSAPPVPANDTAAADDPPPATAPVADAGPASSPAASPPPASEASAASEADLPAAPRAALIAASPPPPAADVPDSATAIPDAAPSAPSVASAGVSAAPPPPVATAGGDEPAAAMAAAPADMPVVVASVAPNAIASAPEPAVAQLSAPERPASPDPVAPAAAAVAAPRSAPEPVPLPAEPARVEPAARSDPAPTTLALAAPPASLAPSDPGRAVEGAIGALDCARVSARVDLLAGRVVLAGHVRSGDDRARLAAQLGTLPGIRSVESGGLSLVGEPYCRVLSLLGRPEFKRSAEQRGDLLTVGAANGPGNRHAVGGEPLELTLSAPEFDAFLYVDHFSANGRVAHLLPTDRLDNMFKANTGFRLGPASPLGRKAVIGPPYGLDVVLVVGSSEAIFVRARPPTEDAAAYLAAMDARLQALRGDGVKPRIEYAYYLVTTSPPPGGH